MPGVPIHGHVNEESDLLDPPKGSMFLKWGTRCEVNRSRGRTFSPPRFVAFVFVIFFVIFFGGFCLLPHVLDSDVGSFSSVLTTLLNGTTEPGELMNLTHRLNHLAPSGLFSRNRPMASFRSSLKKQTGVRMSLITCRHHVGQKYVPNNCYPGKWKHGPKPAVHILVV